MANSRFYSSLAQQTTITGGMGTGDTTMAVASTAGFPGSFPYTLAVDFGAANFELVEVTSSASLTLTITRAIDGTSASTHNVGAVVRHVVSARDMTDSRTHEAASTNVHGLSGGAAVVGTTSTQTLSNKTLTRALGSLQNISMFNVGATGITQIIGDSANPSASRLEIKDNESTLNTMLFVQSTGNVKMVKASAEADNIYRLRLTDNNGTTDRMALLAGGTLTLTPTSTTTFPGFEVQPPDVSSTKRAIRIAATGGGTERFTVWNDGRLEIVNQAAGQVALRVTAAASPSTDIFQIRDSGSNSLLVVQSSGVTVANKGAVIAQPGVTTGNVLQVGGSNLGFTGNLQAWVDASNSIVSTVDKDGNITTPNNFSTLPVTTTSAAITATTGWTITSQFAMKAHGMITIIANLQRSGANLTFDANGDITDADWFTVNAGWIPNSFYTSAALMPVPSTNGGTQIMGRMTASSGVVQLVAANNNATISTGANCRIHLTYHA